MWTREEHEYEHEPMPNPKKENSLKSERNPNSLDEIYSIFQQEFRFLKH